MFLAMILLLRAKKMAANEYKVFHKPQDLLLTRRKLEGYNKIAEITNYYRRNPIKFMEDILGV